MRNNHLLALGFLGILLIAYLFYNPTKIENIDQLQGVEIKQDIDVKPIELKAEKMEPSEPVLVIKKTLNLENLTQISTEKRSAFEIMETYKFCYRYFASLKNAGNNYDILNRFNEKLNDFQKQYFDDYYQNCEQVNKAHPEYHLDEVGKIKQQLEMDSNNPLWDQIVKGDIEVESLTNQEIEELITQNNLEILTQAPDFLRPYYEEVIHWGIEEVLQNRQYDYVNYILKNAHQLYLCDLGADCSSQSSTMAMFCFLTPESCGLDYPVFIESVLTTGQRQDIYLAYNYLVGKYNHR
jgi:hypothetical protein